MKKIPLKFWIVGSLLLVMLGVVVYLSAQPREITSQLTQWYKDTFPRFIVNPRFFGYPTLIRESAHIYEYFAVGLLVAILLTNGKHRGRRILYALLICVAISNLDQLSKPFLSGREYNPKDLIYDAMGYITAILVVNLVDIVRLRYKKEKEQEQVMKQAREAIMQPVFTALKAALWNLPYDVPNVELAESMHKEMKLQAVAGLVSPLMPQWKKESMGQIMFFLQLAHEQNELIQLLQHEGLHPVIVKGCAAAVYYPQPELRAMGDIDVLVPVVEFEQALQVMVANQYTIWEEERFNNYHVNLRKHNIHFELHHKPAGIEEDARGSALMQMIAEGFSNIEEREVSGYMVPMLPPLQNGLVLLLHIEKHLKEGLGLRQIIDWMLFVNQHITDEDWETEYRAVFAAVKLETLAVTVTRMCQLYLGLSEEFTWCHSASQSVCQNLMSYIIEQGNFGEKKKREEYGANVLTRNGSGIQFFKNLQKNGEQNWAILPKHPKLRCFAWAYQICHYVKQIFSREDPIGTTVKDLIVAGKRKRLLKKLK